MAFASFSYREALLLAGLSLLTSPLAAQDIAEEEEDYSQIVVTGAVRQGGAQDVQHFRSMSEDEFRNRGLPETTSLTVEGLLGEHDLTLPATQACPQLFCISAHAMPAQLTGREGDIHFIGLGFDSGIDADAYRAGPLSLVAVIDRSGSMNGQPIDRVKEGLHAVIDQMREGDRMGIVIYGSETLVHQPVIDFAGNADVLHRAVDTIEINGFTYMAAGLKLGYETAFAELPNSNGRTRLMLFTDENPNVGNTSPNGFMGQALAGSRLGVGLTTIGVGAHYDAELATRISSVRGGNLFFLAEEGSGRKLFNREFENMVSEVAHDLVFSISPAPGYRVSGVFGVPGETITEGANGTLTFTIGSAFLSSNGGGIYATLESHSQSTAAGAATNGEAALAEITVAYTDAVSQRRETSSAIAHGSNPRAPDALVKAQLLVEEYLVVSKALALYHEDDDAKGAAEMLAGLADRLEDAGLADMEDERKLVTRLLNSANRLAGIQGGPTLPWDVIGEWEVLRTAQVDDLSRGDLVKISKHGEFITHRTRGRDSGEEIRQDFSINERQLHIEGTDLVLDYNIRGDRLTLRGRLDGVEIVLVKNEA